MKEVVISFAALAAMPLIAGVTMPKPDLGENVRVFSPEDGLENIHRATEAVFQRQHKRQFGPERQAFLFLPGDYSKITNRQNITQNDCISITACS